MIPALGAGGPGFKPRDGPFCCRRGDNDVKHKIAHGTQNFGLQAQNYRGERRHNLRGGFMNWTSLQKSEIEESHKKIRNAFKIAGRNFKHQNLSSQLRKRNDGMVTFS